MEKYTYTVPTDAMTGKPSESVLLRSDGVYIPVDTANSDYQAYLATLASELVDPALLEKPKK